MRIHVTAYDFAFQVQPWKEEFAALSTAVARSKQVRWEHGRQNFEDRSVRIPLYTVEGRSAFVLPGLLDRFLFWFKQQGYEVDFQDKRTPLPEPDLSRMTCKLLPGQDVILSRVLSARQGIVKATTGAGKSFLMTTVCQVYPDQRILIVTNGVDLANSLTERLENVVDCSVRRLHRPSDAKKAQILVAVRNSLHHVPERWPHMILYDEVHGAAARTAYNNLLAFLYARRLGFSATPFHRADRANLIVEALFGPTLVNLDYRTAQKLQLVSPIEIWTLETSGVPINARRLVDVERYNIWQNRARNALIADIARRIPAEESVLIFVSTVEHAYYLRQMLPEFEVVHSGISPTLYEELKSRGLLSPDEPPTVDREKIKEEFKSGKCKRVISTFCWKEGVDFPHLKWMIRADATGAPIPALQTLGRLSRRAPDKSVAIAIDLQDKWHKTLKGRFFQRLRHYSQEGYTVRYARTKQELIQWIRSST